MTQSDLPPLNWLRAFEASCRHLSFTGAAGELGMTQSAVSQQIKSLESYLGHALFYRRTRVLEITETGRHYLPSVQEAFAALHTSTRSLRGEDRSRTLQIQSNLSFGVGWLTPHLPDLFARYPWLRVNISTAIWDPERTASDADVEIRFGFEPEGVRSDLLIKDSYFPVGPAGFKIAEDNMPNATLFDCAGLTCHWDAWFFARGLPAPQGRGVTYASTFAVSMSAAQNGAGLALAHRTIAARQLDSGLLQRLSDFELPMQEGYYLIAPEPTVATPAQRAFCDWIKGKFNCP